MVLRVGVANIFPLFVHLELHWFTALAERFHSIFEQPLGTLPRYSFSFTFIFTVTGVG